MIFKKCPKRVLILFWIIVALRLTIPVNFNSPTSALNIGMLFPSKSTVTETTVYDPETRLRVLTTVDTGTVQEPVTETVPRADTGIESVTDTDTQAPVQALETEQKTSKISFKTVIPFVWFGVMAALLIFSAVRYMIFYSKARWSSRSFDGRYYMANNIDSPFVVGIFSPKIFFPINMDDDEREYVLNHEWTHIKNKDGLTKFLSYIVLCIHWFNPLVWLAFVILCADIEMRVDEETTSNFSLSMVKEYCKSLVNHAADDKGGAFMQSTAFSGLGFGGMETKLRVTNLLSKKITSTAIQITSIVVTMIFTLLVSASSVSHQKWVREAPEEPQETTMSESAVSDESAPESSETYESFADYTAAYLSFVENNGVRNANFKYDLIYIDSDNIPEFVVDDYNVNGNDFRKQSLYVFRDGRIVPVYEGLMLDAYGTESYYYVPYDDNIIHSYVQSDGTIICKRYTLNDLMECKEALIKGHITDYTYFVEDSQVEYDEFSERFNFRAANGIFGSYSSQDLFDYLSGNVSALGETAEGTAGTGETTIETLETTETTQSSQMETTQNNGSCFSGLPDNTALEILFENDNRVSGSFGTVGVDIYGNNQMGITVNDRFFACYALSSEYTCIYLLKDYGKTYIYIQFLYGGDDYVSVYSIDDNSCEYVGSVSDLTLDERISYPRTFRCIETYGPDATMDIYRYYKVSESNGLPVPDTARTASFMVKKSLKCSQDLTGRVMIDGMRTDEVATIPAGSLATPVKTDDVEYLDVTDTYGNVIRMEFSAVDYCFTDRESAGKLYDKINTLFEPA